uniref:Inactive serine protease PAMR1 n=1 Tax=Paramormyrops kingsleyae TaxID=1676925 RepID=A0A3B3R228_9TELE
MYFYGGTVLVTLSVCWTEFPTSAEWHLCLSDYRFWYDSCPGSEWSIMCQGCCEYDLIRCKCPTQGSPVGYAVPCCRNAVNECDPCIIHPGCSIFENCKRCNNGTWVAKDDFFVRGKYCAECRPGWSGGDCMRCGGVIRKAQGHVVLESYPTNARCEWTLQVEKDFTIELRYFRMISLEFDYSCRYDYIEVRDGDGLSSRVIGRFCGNERPPPILSSGNSLHILFVSDGYKNFDGFFATFQESSACSSSPCRHDGTCVLDSLGSYRCACLAGYTGRHCENGKPYLPRLCRDVAGHLVQTHTHTHTSGKHICMGTAHSFLWKNANANYDNLNSLSPVQKFYSSSTVRKVYDPVVPTKGPPVLAELPQGYHHLYTHIEYECASPFYHHSGSSHRTCLKTGKWSGRHVSCSPGEGSRNYELTAIQKPADTLWPWHAAIYRRSSAGIETGMGGWQLVCSGALVNQRSVVVAAHCVTELGKAHPIIPADVKVVMGKHYRSELRETKSLQHLRVSAVLVHSNYDPLVLDSDLAVLKLLDKARVGERVLPVCLPDVWEGQAAAHQAYVIGWPILPGAGGTEAEGTARAGLVELADMVACERQFAQHGAAIGVTDNMLCGRQHPRALSDICPADTGGIVILPAPDHPEGLEETRRVWTLLGLVSFGYDRRACSPELYTVYTRVSSFKDWIQRNMK